MKSKNFLGTGLKMAIKLIETSKTFDRYYLKFNNGSIGLGGIHKDGISRFGKYSLDVPGSSNIQNNRFKTKSEAIKALRAHTMRH